MVFLAKIRLANGMTPKVLEKCGERVIVTIGFNVVNVIFRIGIIILESQRVLTVFFWKNTFCAKLEKHEIDM